MRADTDHGPVHSRQGFTLIELLTVIVIIMVLAGLLLPAVQKAREKGRQSKCMSNLHQFSVGISVYRNDNDGRLPDWLSSMHPKLIHSPASYLCPSDPSQGADGSKPDDAPPELGDQYVETDDTGNNPAITGCSYLYECCAAACSWFASDPGYINGGVIDANEDGVISWGEVKAAQLLNGDAFHPGEYDETMFPMIRCFHHHDENRFRVPDPNQPGNYVYQGLTINVAMAGNVYRAPVHWELFGGATQ